MIGIILNVAMFLILVWITFTFVRAYLSAEGVWYQRIWSAAKGSLTVLWAQFVVFAMSFVDVVATIADAIDPGSAEAVKAVLPTQYVAAFTVFLMLITMAARFRSLGK